MTSEDDGTSLRRRQRSRRTDGNRLERGPVVMSTALAKDPGWFPAEHRGSQPPLTPVPEYPTFL